MDPVIEGSWKAVLRDQFDQPRFAALKSFLLEERKRYRIFPPGSLIFNAFNCTSFDQVKVVILGQDPYHGPGQAHGLCFSVPEGVAQPPSLVNIFKEIHADLGLSPPAHGNLTKWANQGILLLNATLTVRENQAGSHQGKGWEQFTDAAILALSQKREGLIFLLWGNYAIAKREMIDTSRHFILTAPHPSPLSASRGFFGCRHFSRVNDLLRQMGKEEIDWSLR
ncbi:MAG: uracil-DNA glycosylase [Bacteroidetes bacterium]|nr:MAG: uracil-DNA glycosylase [Bacteroidota bacterium]